MNNKISKYLSILLSLLIMSIMFSVSTLGLNIKYGNFPDVEDNHWAKQVITKMNLRNVVSGYEENGVYYFKPDKAVNKLEAVIMGIRTLSLQEKSNNTGGTLPFTVPDWAKGAVLTAVDEGLIVGSDFVWNQEASRAWVAQLLVRMINKEDELSSVSEDILPYYDSNSIPSQYVNYVKVANKYGLIKGNANNAFLPNQSVTRAQMVAFLSRVEPYVEKKASKVIIGNIKEINDTNISVQSDEGIDYTLICNISSNMYGSNGEIWITDLNQNDRVYLIVDGNIIQYLELDPPQSKVLKISGTILQVYPEENTIVIKTEEEKLETIQLLASTKIVKETDDSLDITALNINSEVCVYFDSEKKPTRVNLISAEPLTGDVGIIYNIDLQNKIITLKKEDGLSAFYFDDKTQIEINNNRFATINDIQTGDQVNIEATNGILTKLILSAEAVELSTSGTVKQISIDDRILTFAESETNQLKAFIVSSNAEISFKGEAGSFSEVLVGDVVDVTIEEGQITGLSITNRKLHDKQKGIVVGTDHVNRILTIKDTLNELHAYKVASDAEIIVNNSDSYLSYITIDMQIELELTDEEITYLSAKNTIKGTVIRADENANILELTLETGETKIYTVSTNVDVDIEDEGSSDLDDVNKGDIVEIKIENSKVTEINVQRTINYKITKTYDNSSKVMVVDSDNDSHNLYLYSAELIIPGKDNPEIEDLKENDIIKVTYLGFSLEKVEIVPSVIGNVTSIDSVNKIIKISTFDGRNLSYEFNSSSSLTKNNYTYYHMSPLNVGDRVAVEEGLNNGRIFNIMEKISGKVGAVYKDKTRIYLQITQTTWKQYDMITTAYLHQGSIELSPAEIKLNDNVDIYLVNNRVYEVLKK